MFTTFTLRGRPLITNATRPCSDGILVLDYGSQYTLLILRRLREAGIYSEVIDGHEGQPPADFDVRGIILSGGPDSVNEAEARTLPDWVLARGVPVLGICYGMQLLMQEFGGSLRSGQGREYGRATLVLESDIKQLAGKLFFGLPAEQDVWMSHGDDLEAMPPGFTAIGRTESGVLAAVVHDERPIAGLQFHPEVVHTEHGQGMLAQFAIDLCGMKRNWQPSDILSSLKQQALHDVGDGHVLMAVSGGVDSTVAAVFLAQALGPDRVTAVFVDHGLLRQNEAAWVVEKLQFLGIKHLEHLSCAERFLSALAGVADPEEKRKIIGRLFVETFQEYAQPHAKFTHLGQGTLYPDVIESAGHGAGAKVIKSHHNVGGLPETLKLKLAEPFRYLFKDEVRKLGLELGIPDELIHRHPFPGPGLGVRIPGAVDAEKIAILQAADAIYIDELRRHGWYDKIWQAFAVLLPVKTVGVMGDNRTYQYACSLRAVAAADGMTASVSPIPMDVLTEISDKIVRQVDGINRVLYDITSKPPATIEWE